MRSMMFDVVKLSAQFGAGHLQGLCQLIFQIANPGRIAQTISKLPRQSWSMTVSVPRSTCCLALQNREATTCRERGRPVRPFIADTHRFKLAAFCLLPTAYFPLSAHRPLPTAHRSSRRRQDLLM